MCLWSELIINPKYKSNKKNGGNIPPLPDQRVKYVPIGCGQCIECRKQKARGWQVRLHEDIKQHTNGKFITLTFSDEAIKEITDKIEPGLKGYDLDNQIATYAIRKFCERWRKKYKQSVRHWLVTELGHNGTENIHLHGIIWTNETVDEIERIWNSSEYGANGFVWKGKKKNGKLINYVNARTVSYIVKYIHKVDTDHKAFKSKVLTSPGIGHNYTKGHDWKSNKFNGPKTIETYRTRQGYKISMPIYWRNKIYTEKEREQLWLQRLDKNERWICGERVDISSGEQEYYKLLEYYRRENKKLGYGDGTITWDRQQYEQKRRELLTLKRIQNATNKKRSKETTCNNDQPKSDRNLHTGPILHNQTNSRTCTNARTNEHETLQLTNADDKSTTRKSNTKATATITNEWYNRWKHLEDAEYTWQNAWKQPTTNSC